MLVKLLICQTCQGWVQAEGWNAASFKTKADFYMSAHENNYDVKQMSIDIFRKTEHLNMCHCDKT